MKEKNKVPDECFELFDPPGDHYSSGGKLGRALSGMRTGEPQNEWLRTEPEKYRLFDGSEAERDELSGWRCSHCRQVLQIGTIPRTGGLLSKTQTEHSTCLA